MAVGRCADCGVESVGAPAVIRHRPDCPNGLCPKCLHPWSAHGTDGCDVEVSDWGSLDCGCHESFQTENALSGENGGGGNRTRVTSHPESPCEQGDRPRGAA